MRDLEIVRQDVTRLAVVVAAGFIACSSRAALAQSPHPVAGAWQVTGLGRDGRPWSLVLETSGQELLGTVSSCASNGPVWPAHILHGRVQGDTITFTCTNLDGSETVTFTGRVNGDELALSYERRRTDGGPLAERPPDATGMFGSASPANIVARRVLGGGKEFAGAVNLTSKRLKVEGALFLPRRVARVRAVFVLINSGTSWGGLAATVYADPQVRELAATVQAALLLLRVTPLEVGAHMYFIGNAAAGGDEGLIQLLDRLAVDSAHSEMSTAPLLFWGHSAAGPFGQTFARRHPGRTIALIGYHSGIPGIPKELGVFKHIPALFLQAGADVANDPTAFARLDADYVRGRVAGAPWTFGIEPDAVHQDPADVRKASALLIPWISAVLRLRLREDGLQDLRADPGNQSWFPDEESRRGWTEVTRKGSQ